MTENPKTEPNLTDEIRELGNNLSNILHTIWDSPERQEIQREIESGISEFSAALNKTAQEFSTSDTGQRIKADLEDLRARANSGELSAQVRNNLMEALRKVNEELDKVNRQWRENTQPTQDDQSGTPNTSG
jgi:ElaB/YqjD/DUF883 family membrane-anchored ribosome-binding protein